VRRFTNKSSILPFNRPGNASENSNKMQFLILPMDNSAYTGPVTVMEGPEVELHSEDNVNKPKRQKLDHLSAHEKMSRRKLKNRVAAQSARDKKKARMDELEIIVNNLKRENDRLKAKNERLQIENSAMSSLQAVNKEIMTGPDLTKQTSPVESAALIHGPLPQGQGNVIFVVIVASILLQLLSQFETSQDRVKPFLRKSLHRYLLSKSETETLEMSRLKTVSQQPP